MPFPAPSVHMWALPCWEPSATVPCPVATGSSSGPVTVRRPGPTASLVTKCEVEVERFGLGLAPPGQEFIPFRQRVREELAVPPSVLASPSVASARSPAALGSPLADPFVASVHAALVSVARFVRV
ncbi:hypothetical protein KEM55_004263 [Ascosphaera atra]|nr:hypothetical protein KEM55_004263 [Ascosphaera atra]